MEAISKNKLLPQNFLIGIFLCILYILDSLYDAIIRCNGEKINFEHHKILFLLNSILVLFVLLFERRYLKNFSAHKTIKWLDCCIILPLLLCFVIILSHYISLNKVIIAFTPLILLIAYWFCWIMLGNSVRSVKDDFIGLLKELGILNIIATLSIPISFASVFNHSIILTILSYAVNIPPLVTLIIIYRRAIAFTKTMDTIKPE